MTDVIHHLQHDIMIDYLNELQRSNDAKTRKLAIANRTCVSGKNWNEWAIVW